jgi:hypothetical protein
MNNDSIWFVIVWSMIGLAAYSYIEREKGEITVYQARCATDGVAFKDCKALGNGVLAVGGVFTYKVDPVGQNVVEKSGLGLSKLRNCTVFDQKNWRCDPAAESGLVFMMDGDLMRFSPMNSAPPLEDQISWWRHMLLRIGNAKF